MLKDTYKKMLETLVGKFPTGEYIKQWLEPCLKEIIENHPHTDDGYLSQAWLRPDGDTCSVYLLVKFDPLSEEQDQVDELNGFQIEDGKVYVYGYKDRYELKDMCLEDLHTVASIFLDYMKEGGCHEA